MKISLLKPQRVCELLLASSGEVVEELELMALEAQDYKKSNTPPEGNYTPLKYIDDRIRRYWIKTSFRTPKKEESCEYYLEMSTGIGGTDAQFIIYLNGSMVQGMDMHHRRTLLRPDTGYEAVIYLYSAMPWAPYPLDFKIIKVNKKIEKLYFDMVVPYETCRDVYTEGSREYCEVLAKLEEACNILDLRIGSPGFLRSVDNTLDFMEREFYGKLCSKENRPVVASVGHTHIDVEWMWDRRQTREKVQRSVATALGLMEEYPEYKIMLSQPELYRYLREEAPEKYEELKERVRQGRWEPEGALYLECDCNLISGESMVRQLIHGKRFFCDEFGVDSRICFLPDVFGYSAAMPQILKKAEVDAFVTSKISWNDTNTVPYDAFMWRGIDGSEIFSAFITGQIYQKNEDPRRRTAYGSGLDSSFIKGAWERFKQKEYCNTTLFTFGYGDGGGGPTYEMLEHRRRLERGLPQMPVPEHLTLVQAVERIRNEFLDSCNKLRYTPRWVGELYLELHRGTYTSQAHVKRSNRRAEFELSALEALNYTDKYFGGEYDTEGLDKAWKIVFHEQFHDILPGSSVKSVYDLVKEDYKRLFAYTEETKEKKLSAITDKLNTDGGIFVYNPLGFERQGEISVDGQAVNTKETIPAFGYKVIKSPTVDCRVAVNGNKAENDFYILTLDAMGRISSLYDKQAQREVFFEHANEFRVYEDFPLDHDAWDMEEYTERKEYKLDDEAEITEIYDGERAGFAIKKKYLGSVIEQRLWLYSYSRRIELCHHIDWHEDHHILKLAFPVNVHTDTVSCEIQFGHIERPTHRNTSWEGAKFEICAQKWLDVSEYGYGMALLNDCKYGYSVDGSTIKLTCIKCPVEPDATADIGEHIFTCALYPHIGDIAESGVIREAYSLNSPLISRKAVKNNGELPECFSMVSCDNDAVMIESIKMAEDSDALVVRLYEAFGSRARCRLSFADGFNRAVITNLLEREESCLEINNNSVELILKPFEITTIKLANN